MPANAGIGVAEAKARVLDSIREGLSVSVAMRKVGRSVKTMDNWRSDQKPFRNGKTFGQCVDEIREHRRVALDNANDPEAAGYDFETWRRKFLGMETYWHQLQWVDLLEGREPRDLHPHEVYEPGNARRLLINTPPFHAKSTVITQHYVAYRICMNRDIRIVIVSKTARMAAKFLYSVKRILTEPAYAALQAAYGPEGGFKPRTGEGKWTDNVIHVAGRGDFAIDPGSKDPTVEAVGIGGHIQGARADLFIVDDCEDDTNVAQWEKHMSWINEQVQSRLYSGRIVVVGTRVAPTDLWSALRDPKWYTRGKSPWTYLGQPAVLDFAEDPKNWKTLWPASTVPLDREDEDAVQNADGTWPTWDGPKLAYDVRDMVPARTWALLYMQDPIGETAVFPQQLVNGAVDGRRKPGPLRPGELGGRRNGMEGIHGILSIDPAGTGEAFALALGVDPATKERWLLNAWAWSGASSTARYADLIEQCVAEGYGIRDIVIEKNAYAGWLINDERIKGFCQPRGITILPHYTGNNKQDPNLGVASMSSLFGALVRQETGGDWKHDGNNLLHIPDASRSNGVSLLLEQLPIWRPAVLGKNLRQDGPMSLWFAELRARQLVNGTGQQITHMPNRFLSPRARRMQMVIPVGETVMTEEYARAG